MKTIGHITVRAEYWTTTLRVCEHPSKPLPVAATRRGLMVWAADGDERDSDFQPVKAAMVAAGHWPA